MMSEQRRYRKAEDELRDFPSSPAIVPSLKKRPEAQGEVRGQRKVKRGRPDQPLPDELLYQQARFHGLDRYIAEGMIRQMAADIGEQRKSTDQPDPVHSDGSQLLRGSA